METKSGVRKSKSTHTNASEELDSLNAETRPRAGSAQKIRRRMEATIEAKAQKRRSREVAASTALRKQLGKS
jgi:hypothetical protein